MKVTIKPDYKAKDRILAYVLFTPVVLMIIGFLWFGFSAPNWQAEREVKDAMIHEAAEKVLQCMKREYGLKHILFNVWEDEHGNRIQPKNLGVCSGGSK